MTLKLDKSAWKRVAFGDVVRNANETIRNLDAAGIGRIIAMEHLDPGELKISRWGSTEDGTTFTRRVRPGQTLFGKRRAYQRKVAFAEFDAICSGDIYTFEADETQILGEFLPVLVQSNEFFDHALGTSAGSLSPRTNWRDLASFEFLDGEGTGPVAVGSRHCLILLDLEGDVAQIPCEPLQGVLHLSREVLLVQRVDTEDAPDAGAVPVEHRTRDITAALSDDTACLLRTQSELFL
jgi:hypothetical protein